MYTQNTQEVNGDVGPPHNIEAEQALLGALLLNNEAHDRVADFMKPEFFYDPLHGEIFEVAAKLIGAGKLANPITLRTFFENSEPINHNLSVPQYLGRLAASATTIMNVKAYGETVRDLALRRILITVGQDIVAHAFNAPVDATAEGMIVEAEARLAATAQGENEDNAKSVGDAAASAMEIYNAAYMRSNGMSGIPTGLADLDSKTGGLQKTDLIILAGRPSMGKTALVTNIAENAARSGVIDDDGVEQPGEVHFFSLEMSEEQLAGRMISGISEVPSDKLRRGAVDELQMRKALKAANDLESLPIFIDATGGISIAQMRARARRRKRKHGTELIIVDYLQLMTTPGVSGGNRVQEITAITSGLKAMAKELNVPVIALSQLSRNVEQREDKRPQLSDLRESGSIEQDADVVMFVYREEYYLERLKPDVKSKEHEDWLMQMQEVEGKAEVILGKQRHGPIGTVDLAFEGEYTRFSNLALEAAPSWIQ